MLLLLSLMLVLAGCGPSYRQVDAEQGRLDTATPPLKTSGPAGQTFVSHARDLIGVEVLLVLYGSPSAPAGPDEIWECRLREGSPSGREVCAVTVRLAGQQHNDPLLISFPRQPASQGRTYYLEISAVSGERAALWFDSVDAYADGTMYLGGQQSAGDLRFRTFNEYGVISALSQAGAMLGRGWSILVVAALVLTLPGLGLYLALFRSVRSVGLADLGAWVISLSLAVLPLSLLWTGVLGVRWRPWLAGMALALLVVLILRSLLRRPLCVVVRWPDLLVLLIFGLTMAARFLQVRELVLPAWVDSVHHTLITGLIMDRGAVPVDYGPTLPGAGFIYHFGFHAVAAWLGWLTGLDPAKAVLIYGQILNALAALAAYLLAKRLSKRPIGGVTAMLVVGLLSPMPAYYVTWGRYTQLAGMVLLPLAAVTAMECLSKRGARALLLAAIAAAGLGLTHSRVAVFYAGFVMAYLALTSWQRRCDRAALAALWARLGILVGLTMLLLVPWVAQLWRFRLGPALSASAEVGGLAGHNAMPKDLLFFPGMAPLFVVAALGAVAGIVPARHRQSTLLILLWVALLYGAVNLPWAGGRLAWFLPNSALAIAVYLPLSLLIAEMVSVLADLGEGVLQISVRFTRVPLRSLAGQAGLVIVPLALVAGLSGGWRTLAIVNPQTILASQDDLAAMEWIRHNTPTDARFLVNAVPWQLGLYRGSDSGCWIPLLTGRGCSLPPVLYRAAPPEFFKEVGEVSEAVSRGELPGGAGWRERCRELNLTYVYVGAKGGPLKAEQLRTMPGLSPVYVHGPVWIFQIDQGENSP